MDANLMSSLPKLLITGASGFTGKHACHHFSKAGFEVIAVTRTQSFNEEIQTEHCDLTNKEAVRRMIKKIKPEFLLHLAGQNQVGQSWLDPVMSLEVNAVATAYLLEALRQENPSCKIVIVGSALQFDPANMSTLTHPYSLSKTLQVVIAQSWAILYNMHIVIAKPSNLIGTGFSNGVCSIFAKKIVDMEENKSKKVLEVNNLYAQRDYIDIRDALSAYEILLVKGKSGEIYDISSGKSHSLEEVINCFKSLTEAKFETLSRTDEKEQKVEIIPYRLKELGWKPNILLKSSLQDILTFYRKNNR
ncbi:NAD-dependent epimerase/dehydratase family protein [Priestia megaterium]|uniref:NAD-dependent epimerase/dehydratase family protein n=1 Tax=Priestia megaterium TaxID=1404 RepID=UPI002079B05C|nr:NAD-dependent epimerase/dehydratase family protein [Priestia megaterium]USL45762.1 NAD-dependent epimerase/dehydratase family protein [Priestia megaterium]